MDFDEKVSATIEAVDEGKLPSDSLLKLVRSNERGTLDYCIRRLSSPDVSVAGEIRISRLLQQAGLIPLLVEKLLELDLETARKVARIVQNAERGLDLRLAGQLQSEEDEQVERALDLLAGIAENRQLVPSLFSLLNHANERIQARASSLIQDLDTELVYSRRLLQHTNARVRANALEKIAGRTDSRGLEFLRQGASDPDNRVRTLAAVGLTRTGDPLGLQILLRMIRDPSVVERRSAAWGLGMSPCGEAVDALESASRSDPDERVREMARIGLERIRARGDAQR